MKTIYTYKIKGLGRSLALAAFLVAGALKGIQAQDQPHYSMYMLHQPLVNVGSMGSYDQIYGGILYNTQLAGFDGAPMLGLIDMGFPIAKTNLLLGFTVGQERIGISNRTTASLNAAYRIKLNIKHYLALGLGVGGQFVNANFGDLNTTNPDPLASQTLNYFTPTVRFGAYYFTENLYIGASVGNIITNSLSNPGSGLGNRIQVKPEDMHFNLQAGYQVKFAQVWRFQPSVLLKYSAGAPLQADVNAHFLYNNMIGFGLSYRTLGNLVVLADYTIKNRVTIGYSVNFGLQNARSAFYHGHEVYIGFKLKKKGENTIPVDVPRF